MKKVHLLACIFLIIITGMLKPENILAQSYIDFSKYTGGSAVDDVSKMQVINGETYLVGSTASANFPATNGSTFKGKTDMTVTKYSSNGNILYAAYLGGIGSESFYSMKIINGEVYILATTDSTGYPVTNSSAFKGKLDIVVTRLNTNGGIIFSTYLGGIQQDYPASSDLAIAGNDIFIAGNTESPDFPVTGSSIFHGGRDGFITKMNSANGAIIMSEFFGGSLEDNINIIDVDNGSVFLIGSATSIDIPVTIGNSPGAGRNTFMAKLNSSNFNIAYCRYLGGSADEFIGAAEFLNGQVYITGFTYSKDYPVTNSSTASGQINDVIDGFYTRINSDGSIGFSTYLSTGDLDIPSRIVISGGEVYIAGIGISFNTSTTNEYLQIYKINPNGSFGYIKRFGVGSYPANPSFKVINGELYFAGISVAPDYPVTNGSQFYDGGSGFFTHLSASGDILYSTFLGKMSNRLIMQVSNNKFYLLGNTNIASYPVTDSSVVTGNNDNILIILKPDGTNVYSGYTGGSSDELPFDMAIDDNDVYFCGRTGSADYPVTDHILYQGSDDQFLTKLSFCPAKYYLSNDSLSPKIQTVCKFGLAQIINGEKITVPSDSLPVIFRNGTAALQKPIEATYQWQIATAPAGPWTNIPTATFKDYRPVMGAVNQYYRRLSFTSPDCGASVIHTSDTASAIVNSLTAPTVDAGGPFTTCPGTAISIGGSPTATGGNPPYASYIWDTGAGAGPNPSVSPGFSSIYTVIVTDALGCQQVGQALVFTYKADAGPDKGNCAGTPVKIGTPQIAGVAGIIYDWQPATNLTSTNVAQPFANPAITTDYALELSVPKSGGGTCTTKDTVRITPVAAPVTTDIAGPDRVICLKDNASLGSPAEAGFTYTWSPGSYLTNNTTAATSYYPGDILMPVPNPVTINLTAQKDGCSFTDQVTVATIESRAGLEGCGPRLIGLPDRTPDINETYTWIKISGPGDFTGPVNLPQVPVSASVGGNTIYGLIVSYNGGACFSQVMVTEGCEGCKVLFDVDAKYRCPGFDVNGGDVTLYAFSSLQNAVYAWTPQEGLSAYTGSTVHLTDNIPRVYTVIATDINDTSVHCYGQVTVNDPAFSIPVFPAPDVVACANTPVNIGLPSVAGYTYEWTGSGLSDNFVSNPFASIAFQTSYPIRVTDGNGCEIKDTVLVAVQNVQADAGQDWVICSNGVVQLGTPAQPNTTYLWEPQASPWQNGTDQFSAQPETFVATNVTYTVTATTSAGCVTSDQVNITINNSPAIPDAPDQLICAGSAVLIGSASLPGVTYQWAPATGLNDPTLAQPTASAATSTTYTLLATFPGGCSVPSTDQVTVAVSNPAFNMPDINFCPGNGAFALGTAAPANMNAYSWEPAQLVTNPLIANPNTLNPPPNTITVFTLSVTNTDGCGYTDTITIIPATVAPVAGTDKTICRNQAVTIGSATNTTGPVISYSWTPVTNLNDPSSPNPVFTGTTGGIFTYILTKTDNSISCITKDTVVIKVVDSLLPVMNTPTVCQNSCVQIGTTPAAGIQYHWAPAAGLSNVNIANPLACVGAVTASYTLTASDVNGCSASANIVVGVNAIPAAQITIPSVTACIGDDNVIFNPSVGPAGNYSYLWSPDNGTLSDVNVLTPVINITAAGNAQYILQVTDNITGCTNTAIGNLLVNSCPALSTIGDFMWFDTNADGIQDPAELGLSGTSVKLYNSAGFNVASTITDANGFYSISNISPGNDYYIIFNKPAGYAFTTQNVGGVEAANNSKADLNGRSNNFNIASGINITDIDAGITASGSVPVSLLSFTAILRNRKVLLNWQTTAEYNNHYFDVERSNNGSDFTAIGRVDGNGTTALPHNYSLIDPYPLAGMNYYRLKQVDFDEHGNYSHIVPIQLNNDEIVSAYYNNLSNSIQVTFSKQHDNMQLKLYAANGQMIRSVAAPNNVTAYSFELPVLATGIYMLQIINDKFTYSKKLFIEK